MRDPSHTSFSEAFVPSSRAVRFIAAVSLTLSPVFAAAGQSSFAVSPFVSYIPSAATNPNAGFALTFGGTTGLALRSGAEMSISNPPADSALGAPGGYRPWGADADVMLFLGGLGGGATVFSRALSPYGFAGIGMTGGDSAGSNVVRHSWSYGLGAAIPLGFDADIFAEARWRMSQYVLPTSEGAPDARSSMRFGLSFHVGGGSSGPSRGMPQPRRRHRMEVSDGEQDVEYVVTPAPASPQVVVVQPAPAAEPQVVYVESEPAPVQESQQAVILQRPPERRPRTSGTTVVVAPSQPVISAPAAARPAARVYGRSSARSSARQTVVIGSTRTQRSAAGAIARAPARVQARTPAAASSRAPARVQARTPARAQATTPARTSTPDAASRTQRGTRSRVTRIPE